MHCLYVTQWHVTRLLRPRCYNLTCAIPMQSSTNWAIKPSKSWSFCEFVIFFSRRFATWLRRSILSASNEKKTSGTQGSRWWSIQMNIWKTIHTIWISNPRFRPEFFFTTTLVVCRTTMINHIYSLIFITSFFISFYLSIFQITFLSFLFLTPLILYIVA